MSENSKDDFITLKNKLKRVKDINLVFRICNILGEECEKIYNRSNRILRAIGLSNSFLVFLVTTSSVLTDIYYKDLVEEKESIRIFNTVYSVLLYSSSVVSAAKWYKGDSYKNSLKETSDKLKSMRINLETVAKRRKRNTSIEEYQEYTEGIFKEYSDIIDNLPDIGVKILKNILKDLDEIVNGNHDFKKDDDYIVIVDLTNTIDPDVSQSYNTEKMKFELDRFNDILLE